MSFESGLKILSHHWEIPQLQQQIYSTTVSGSRWKESHYFRWMMADSYLSWRESRVAEGIAPDDAEVGRGKSEPDGGGGPEGMDWSDDMEEVHVLRSKIVDSFESVQKEFE